MTAAAPLSDAELDRLAHLNYLEFAREMARWSGTAGLVVERDGVCCTAAASDFPVLFNTAWRTDDAVAGRDVVAIADEVFAPLGRGYTLTVRDGHPGDADLEAAAVEAGMVAVTRAPELVVRAPVAEVALPDGVELRWVHEGAPAADLLDVADTAYVSIGLVGDACHEAVTALDRLADPHLRVVLAYRDGRAVAGAMTLLSHGIAGVYWVGTVPEARGLGLGDAVTRAVTNAAFAAGARANTLQASQMGEPIYLRMGWQERYRYTGWSRLAPAPTP